MKNLQIEEIYGLYTQTAGVCTDTRNILQGGMFFALKGETFNGNAFAVAALEGGAAYAVVDEPRLRRQRRNGSYWLRMCWLHCSRWHGITGNSSAYR